MDSQSRQIQATHWFLIVVFDLNEMDRLAQIQEFLLDNPNDAFLHYALAQECKKMGDVNKALVEYLWLTKNHPLYVATYYHLGKLLSEEGKKKEAMQCYDAGISIAKQLKEQHSLSELQSAKMDLEYGDD